MTASSEPEASLRRRLEQRFEAWGRLVVRHARLVVLLCVLATVALASAIPDMRVDNSTEAFLHEGDPSIVFYNEFRDRFDRDDRIVLGLSPGEVFDLAFLERLRELHRDLERSLPHVEEVTSLLNVRATFGRESELVVEDLFAEWPQGSADLERIRARVAVTPLYQNLFISADNDFTTVVIKPNTFSTVATADDEFGGFDGPAPGEVGGPETPYLSDEEAIELVHALRRVAARHRAEDFPIHVVGGPVMNVTLNERLARDVTTFMPVTVAALGLILGLLFRRVSGLLLPLAVVTAALLTTFGIMVRVDVPFSVTIQILPAFLLAVGVCDSVHLLVIVYRRLAAGVPKAEAIASAMGHSGLAILMTSLTTAGSLLSFLSAEIRPVYHLGLVAPIGVMVAFLYSVTLLPALLALVPVKAVSTAELEPGGRLSDRFLTACGDFATRRPWTVVAVTALVLAVGAVGMTRVRFGHDALRWFPPDDPLRVASDSIDAALGGVSTLEFVVDTGHDFGLHEPERLARLDRATSWAREHQHDAIGVASAISLVDVVKETHRALNENRQSHYAIPDDRRLVAQELLLFEQSGADDLDDVADGRFRFARLTLRVPWVDALVYPDFIETVNQRFREILGEDMPFRVTGIAEIFGRAFRAVVLSLGRSYAVALAVIVPLMVILIGSLSRGLLAMIPNLIPVFLTLGLMGWLEIPLDASTLLLGAIIIGIAVDDTIHFMHKFNRHLEDLGDPRAAVHETLRTTGAALLFTSLALGAGFTTLRSAYMSNAQEFGLLAGFATAVAFVADVVLGPALMILVTRGGSGGRPAAGDG